MGKSRHDKFQWSAPNARARQKCDWVFWVSPTATLVHKSASTFSISTSFLCPYVIEGKEVFLKGRSPVPFLGWLCVPAVACGISDGAEAILFSSSAPSLLSLLHVPTYSLGYLLPMLSYSFLSLMSAMHPSLGWAFWSDSWELGTHILGDVLEFGIIAKLCFGDAFGAFHTSGMDCRCFFPGAVTILWEPETAGFYRAQDVPPHLCLLFMIKLGLWSDSF